MSNARELDLKLEISRLAVLLSELATFQVHLQIKGDAERIEEARFVYEEIARALLSMSQGRAYETCWEAIKSRLKRVFLSDESLTRFMGSVDARWNAVADKVRSDLS